MGNKLADAGAKGDIKAVDQALRDLKESHKPLLSKARSTAQGPPNSKKDKILEALKDLDSLFPQQEEAARDLARNPKDGGKRAKLEDLNRKIGKDLDELSSMLVDTDDEGIVFHLKFCLLQSLIVSQMETFLEHSKIPQIR